MGRHPANSSPVRCPCRKFNVEFGEPGWWGPERSDPSKLTPLEPPKDHDISEELRFCGVPPHHRLPQRPAVAGTVRAQSDAPPGPESSPREALPPVSVRERA